MREDDLSSGPNGLTDVCPVGCYGRSNCDVLIVKKVKVPCQASSGS